jgi:ribosomal protein S18 acetylase RimI-like enzyme
MTATAPDEPGAGRAVAVRRALRGDLPRIVVILHDDGLGKRREDPSLPLDARYIAAFERLDGDDDHLMLVLQQEDRVVGYLQLSFIPGLSRRGMLRGHIEAVRIAGDRRGQGLGTILLNRAIDECRARDCGLVQLTSDKQRLDARRFYERAGFVAAHEGFKLFLNEA